MFNTLTGDCSWDTFSYAFSVFQDKTHCLLHETQRLHKVLFPYLMLGSVVGYHGKMQP